MRTVLRSVLAAAALSLSLAAPAAADTATADLFLARDDCGATDNPRLDFSTGAFQDACGSLVPLVSPFTETYSSHTLDPTFALDTARPITVAVTMSSRESLGYGLGDQTVAVSLIAKNLKGKTVALGSGEHVQAAEAMLGGANYTATIEIPLSAATAGPFKSYSLDLEAGGSTLAGYVSHGSDSVVSLPVLDGTVIFPPEDEEEFPE